VIAIGTRGDARHLDQTLDRLTDNGNHDRHRCDPSIDSAAAQAQLRRWGGEFRDKVKKAVAARDHASEATEIKEDVRATWPAR
jgi:hypothetical protein